MKQHRKNSYWDAWNGMHMSEWIQSWSKAPWIPPFREHHQPKAEDMQRTRGESGGYIIIRLFPDQPYYDMTTNGWVMEHRWVMATVIGRSLTKTELVHHKNGVKTDNKPDNLEVCTRNSHPKGWGKAYQEGYARALKDMKSKGGETSLPPS